MRQPDPPPISEHGWPCVNMNSELGCWTNCVDPLMCGKTAMCAGIPF